MIRLPPTPTPLYSSAASDVYRRVVVALQAGQAGQLDQVGIAGGIGGPQREVGVLVDLGVVTDPAVEAATGGQVSLGADDRLDPGGGGLGGEVMGAEQVAVVGDR